MIGHMTSHDQLDLVYLGYGSKAVLECEVVSAPASRGISEWREGMTESWA